MNFTNLVAIIKKHKYLLFIIVAVIIVLIHFPEIAKENQDTEQLSVNETEEGVTEKESNSISPPEADKEMKEETITFELPNGNILSVDKERITDFYGWGHLENRWKLEEIDTILDSIKGYWEIGEYIGFVADGIYYGELFDYIDENDPYQAQLLAQYNEKVKSAQENIPDIFFSIKERNYTDISENYIYTNNRFYSSVNIILSLDRMADNYPILSERTTISKDFLAEYPVLYVQFFLNDTVEDQRGTNYRSATIVMTSDNRLLILIDGAFYSIKKIEG